MWMNKREVAEILFYIYIIIYGDMVKGIKKKMFLCGWKTNLEK